MVGKNWFTPLANLLKFLITFNKPINIVLGNEWSAGNLSYHLKSRPAWEGEIEISKLNNLKIFLCIEDICVGNR